MGVRGLQSYMEKKCREAFVPVYIPDLIQPGIQHPSVIIDGYGLTFQLYKKSKLDWLNGGQFIQFAKHIEYFVNQFLEKGIKPIILFDGNAPQEKHDTLVERNLEKLKVISELFGSHFTELGWYFKPPGTGAIAVGHFKLIDGCDVKTTLKEADREIAQLARDDQSCIAILAQDSDFVIFDTKPYLSLDHLDLDAMTTKMYDRQRFCHQIGLDVYNLPLISCMLGNDVVFNTWLTEFHVRLTGNGRPNRFNIIEEAISFIKRESNIRYTDAFDLDLQTLRPFTQVMFGNDPIKCDRLLAGIRTYRLESGTLIQDEVESHRRIHDVSVRKLLGIALNKHVNSDIPRSIYLLMIDGSYGSGAKLEDQGTGLPSSAILYQPIRRRLYGILKNSGTLGCLAEDPETVKEWCVYEGCQLDSPEVIEPSSDISADVRLQRLWFEADEQLKWKTLLEIWNVRNMAHRLETCANWQKIFSIIMKFLVDEVDMRPYEIDALVAQCVSPIAQNVSKIKDLKVKKVYARCVHLASLFLAGYNMMVESLSLCAIPIYDSYIDIRDLFDGNVFNHCYHLAIEKSRPEHLCSNEVSSTAQFHKMKAILDLDERFN
ncbi:Uncharacterised protein g7045 [Pycnogonum litorale]